MTNSWEREFPGAGCHTLPSSSSSSPAGASHPNKESVTSLLSDYSDYPEHRHYHHRRYPEHRHHQHRSNPVHRHYHHRGYLEHWNHHHQSHIETWLKVKSRVGILTHQSHMSKVSKPLLSQSVTTSLLERHTNFFHVTTMRKMMIMMMKMMLDLLVCSTAKRNITSGIGAFDTVLCSWT